MNYPAIIQCSLLYVSVKMHSSLKLCVRVRGCVCGYYLCIYNIFMYIFNGCYLFRFFLGLYGYGNL